MRGQAIFYHRLAYRALSQKSVEYFKANGAWFDAAEFNPKFGSGDEKEKFVSSEFPHLRATRPSFVLGRFDSHLCEVDFSNFQLAFNSQPITYLKRLNST